jgi:hypothetical protein
VNGRFVQLVLKGLILAKSILRMEGSVHLGLRLRLFIVKSFIGLKRFALPEYGVILDMTRVQMQGVLHCEVIMRWNRIGTLVHRLSSSCLSRSPLVQPPLISSSSCPPVATHGFFP